MTNRKYEQRARAKHQEETRARIVSAAMELHGIVGPLATTVSAVADRAGVERLTVYRHFPTTRELLEGCGALFLQTYPLPALTLEPPPAAAADRVRVTLGALYAYYRDRHAYFSVFLQDVERIPDLQALVEMFVFSEIRRAQSWLMAGFDDPPQPDLLLAVFGQALDFWSWRSWMQQGLADHQIVEIVVMVAMQVGAVSAASDGAQLKLSSSPSTSVAGASASGSSPPSSVHASSASSSGSSSSV